MLVQMAQSGSILRPIAIGANLALLVPYACFLLFIAFHIDAPAWPFAWVGIGVGAVAVLTSCLLFRMPALKSIRVAMKVVLALGNLIVFGFGVASGSPVLRGEFDSGGMLMITPLLAIPMLNIAALWRVRPRWRFPLCAACGYDLTGIGAVVCPECGQEVERRTVVTSRE